MKPHTFRVQGFLFSGVSAGIKKDGKRDLGLIFSETPAQVAGLFTTNTVKAAPVQLDLKRIKRGLCQAVVLNSGNANACTGMEGFRNVQAVTKWVAQGLAVEASGVLASSTGVIGVPFPVQKIKEGIPGLIQGLSPDGFMQTVEAIMTTDTFAKVEAATCRIQDRTVKLCGMIKGAGMIRPNVATMLSYLVTDANIHASILQKMLKRAAEVSYNRITVDGDMSTNDTVLLLANGKAGHRPIRRMDEDGERFQSALIRVCQGLTRKLIQDGEGATKLIEIEVKGARNFDDAKKAAYALAHSPLVKTAFFGEDANWGRILCTLGYSGVRLDPNRIDVHFDRAPIVKDGMSVGLRLEEKAARVIKKQSFKVTIDLHLGKGLFSVLTTDLSIEYVKINGSYRS